MNEGDSVGGEGDTPCQKPEDAQSGGSRKVKSKDKKTSDDAGRVDAFFLI